VARLFNAAGLVTVCAFLSPYEDSRRQAREIVGKGRFVEIYLSAPKEVCSQRTPEKLYDLAETGEIRQFSGVTAPYEPPTSPDLDLPTHEASVAECVERVIALLKAKGLLKL